MIDQINELPEDGLKSSSKKSKQVVLLTPYCYFKWFTIEIGTNIQNKILPTKKYYTDFLLNPNKEPFFVTPTTDEEISDIISDLNITKSAGSNSIPTNVITQIKDVISAPLAKICSLF